MLLLDEPSNDLDVETLRALEEALLEFAGCVLVISHDRWFLDRIATHILAFEGDSQVVFFNGNYQEYEADKKKRLGEEAAKPHRIKYKALKLMYDNGLRQRDGGRRDASHPWWRRLSLRGDLHRQGGAHQASTASGLFAISAHHPAACVEMWLFGLVCALLQWPACGAIPAQTIFLHDLPLGDQRYDRRLRDVAVGPSASSSRPRRSPIRAIACRRCVHIGDGALEAVGAEHGCPVERVDTPRSRPPPRAHDSATRHLPAQRVDPPRGTARTGARRRRAA